MMRAVAHRLFVESIDTQGNNLGPHGNVPVHISSGIKGLELLYWRADCVSACAADDVGNYGLTC